MSRKVTVEVKVKLTINADYDQDLSEVLDEMEHEFIDTTGGAVIEDSEILDYEVIDSR